MDVLAPSLAPRPAFFPAADAAATEPAAPNPSVAIITRTKNRVLLLHRAVSSVLCQRYEAWHLYIVNDGGDPAEVEAMLETYRPALAGRVTVIHHPESLGMERASNAALARATEDLVVVHDDDDAWHPDFLPTMTAWLSAPAHRGFVAVACGCVVVQERIEDGVVREVGRQNWMLDVTAIDFRRIMVGNQFPPICLLFRRRVLPMIGGYNGELPVLGDWDFNLRLLLLGDIGYVNRPLAYYCHRVKGTASSYSNTVVDGNAQHDAQNVRLRNGMIRAALAERPELLGLLQPLLHAIHDRPAAAAASEVASLPEWRVAKMERELVEIHNWIAELRMVASWQRKMLRPVQWAYARLRRLVRGR
jgi:GT2 family glycosyltransferase